MGDTIVGVVLTGNLYKNIFAGATFRAYPIFGKVIKRCSCGDPVVGVSDRRVIDIVTDRAFVFFHVIHPFFSNDLPDLLSKSGYHCKIVLNVVKYLRSAYVKVRHGGYMEKLIKEALKARKGAYAPYSKFNVGAAIETKGGKIYAGSNIENASYGVAICAERVALFNAVSDGERVFRRIAVATGSGGAKEPCGICRQALSEFSPDIEIIMCKENGKSAKTRLSKLFPKPFVLKK